MNFKKIIFLLVLSIYSVSTYSVELPVDGNRKVELGGSARIRPELVDHDAFNSTEKPIDFIGTRFQVHFGFEDSGFRSFFQAQYSKSFGELNQFSGQASGVLRDDVIFLHQGFVQFFNDWMSFWIGRKEIAYGDELVIGKVGWSNIGRSFDHATFRINVNDMGWIDFLFLSRVEGTGISNFSLRDHQLLGVYSSFSTGIFKAIDGYALVELNDLKRVGIDDDRQIWVLGGRVKGKTEGFDFRLEVTGELIDVRGTDEQNSAFQGDLELGLLFSMWRIALEFAYASKDYRQLYPTGHKWLGHQDFFSRRNIMDAVFHLRVTPLDVLSFYLDVHTYFRADDDASMFRFNGKSIGEIGGEKYAGIEFDFFLNWTVFKYLKLKFGASTFFPGEYIKENLTSRTLTFFYVQSLSVF